MQRKSGGGEVERTGNGAVKVRTKTEQLGEVISLVHSLLIRAEPLDISTLVGHTMRKVQSLCAKA